MSTSTSIDLFIAVDAFDSKSIVVWSSDCLDDDAGTAGTVDSEDSGDSILTLDIKAASILIAIPGGDPQGNPCPPHEAPFGLPVNFLFF